MPVFTEPELMELTVGMSTRQRDYFLAKYYAERKNRILILIISIAFGGLGIDRFLVGDTGLGILKLLTGGVFGILWFADIFLITGRVNTYNRLKAQEIALSIRQTGPGGLFDQF
jgi:TM2 domain-containing membrane protein YozV